MPVGEDLFLQVAALLLVSALVGMLAARLGQPLVVAFIAVGLLAGPSAAGLVEPGGDLELLAEIGVALLLFAVGLKLDLHVVRSLGKTVLLVGSAQVVLTAGAGYGLALALGLGALPALYVGLGLAFSSTIIVVKLLSDRRELDDLHGRLAVGILIVQDLVVVIAMIVLTASGEAGGAGVGTGLALAALKGAAFLGGLAVLVRWVLVPLLHRLARLPELLVLFSIAWAVSLAAAGELLAIGTEVGAFLAGVSLASTPYREAIGARLVSVRDFLLLFFFIDLGTKVELGEMGEQLLPALVLSCFVLVAKPLLVAALLGARGYRRRVAFTAAVPLAQISEFSLILAALGLGIGHLEEDTIALVTAVAFITIAASSYLVLYGDALFERLGPGLALFERRHSREAWELHPRPTRPDVVVLGLGRYGGAIVEGLRRRGPSVLGVDYDPEALAAWDARGLDVVYGDAEDPELLHTLPLPETGWLISTVRRVEANLTLLHALHHGGYGGKVAVAAHHLVDAKRLEAAGADLILRPYADAAATAVDLVGRLDGAHAHGGRTGSCARTGAQAAAGADRERRDHGAPG